MVLLQKGDFVASTSTATLEIVNVNSKLDLSCPNKNIVLWKKRTSAGDIETLAHISFGIKIVAVNGYELTTYGSLVVYNVGVRHEGFYVCIYSDGMFEKTKGYEVSVYGEYLMCTYIRHLRIYTYIMYIYKYIRPIYIYVIGNEIG